jgi:4-hydroxy-3-polyprenylbenzoate decarboxylase
MDMREWIAQLDKDGELRRITAEVDWDRELGAIARRVLEKRGPALLFEAIKGYRAGRCTKLFTGGLATRERLALSRRTSAIARSSATACRRTASGSRRRSSAPVPSRT